MKKFHSKNMKKATAVLLAVSMTVGNVPFATYAAQENTEKEEVVYINLHGDGSVKEINVVNIFEMNQDGTITDYGKYKNVKNMTTTEEIFYSGDTVTIDTGKGKLYYEGELDSKVMPWNIHIHYYMDGVEYSAEEMAGKSGQLKITMSVQENTNAEGTFFEDYALQASISLDTKKCKNIAADGATVANVGSDKQLTYTILPGQGTEVTITADVEDFSLSGISINGIPMNLDIEVEDEELMSQITELVDAIAQVDEGTGQLKDGAVELKESVGTDLSSGVNALESGASQLKKGAGTLVTGGTSVKDGAGSLTDGSTALDNGMNTLKSGIAQLQAGLDALNEKSGELTSGSAQVKAALTQLQKALNGVSASAEEVQALVQVSSQIKAGIGQLVDGTAQLEANVNFQTYKALMAQNGVDIDALLSGNAEAIKSINNILGQVDTIENILAQAGISSAVIGPMKEQYVSLANQLIVLLQGNTAAISGMEIYLDNTSESIGALADGAKELQENYETFDTAIGSLANILANLIYQMTELKDAVNLLVEEYGKLDESVLVYTDGVAQVAASYGVISEGASALASGSKELKKGSEVLYAGTQELLNGIVSLYEATGTLEDGTGALDDGVAELLAGVVALYDGTSKLKDGTGELHTETSGMEDEISTKIDGLISTISGGDGTVSSFVSEKNTNIKAVQFVIQTESIEAEEVEAVVAEPEEALTFWQKLVNLFAS